MGSASYTFQELLVSFISETVVPLTARELEVHRPLPVLHADFCCSIQLCPSSPEFILFVRGCLLSPSLSQPSLLTLVPPGVHLHHPSRGDNRLPPPVCPQPALPHPSPTPLLSSCSFSFFLMWRQRGDAQRVCMSEREREREEKMRWTERKKEIKARVSGFPFGWKDQVLVSNLEKRLKTAGKERSEAGIWAVFCLSPPQFPLFLLPLFFQGSRGPKTFAEKLPHMIAKTTAANENLAISRQSPRRQPFTSEITILLFSCDVSHHILVLTSRDADTSGLTVFLSTFFGGCSSHTSAVVHSFSHRIYFSHGDGKKKEKTKRTCVCTVW